jgi:hypothetical protein
MPTTAPNGMGRWSSLEEDTTAGTTEATTAMTTPRRFTPTQAAGPRPREAPEEGLPWERAVADMRLRAGGIDD